MIYVKHVINTNGLLLSNNKLIRNETAEIKPYGDLE